MPERFEIYIVCKRRYINTLPFLSFPLRCAPIATDAVALSVCLSVGHVREFCRNGRTDRHADWRVESGVPKEPCVRWGRDPPREGAILGLCGPLKSLGVRATTLYAAKKSTATVGLRQLTAILQTCQCHIYVVLTSHENSVLLRCGLSSKFFDHLLLLLLLLARLHIV